MDDPACDLGRLFNTYRQFALINAYLSRWGTIYRRYLRPRMAARRPFRMLDVGFGGGDIARSLDRWARRDGFDLRITAIETDARALDFVRQSAWPDTIAFQVASTRDLVNAGRTYDAVISNAVLHHLDRDALAGLLEDSATLAERVVVHNDLVRSRAAYMLFSSVIAPWLRDSCAAVDGRLSIRRSFTPAELRAAAGDPWRVEPIWPYRQLLVLRRNDDDRQHQAG